MSEYSVLGELTASFAIGVRPTKLIIREYIAFQCCNVDWKARQMLIKKCVCFPGFPTHLLLGRQTAR